MFSAFKADNGLYGIFNPNPCNSDGVPVHEGKSTALFCICPVLNQIHLVILSVCLDLIRYYLPLSLH